MGVLREVGRWDRVSGSILSILYIHVHVFLPSSAFPLCRSLPASGGCPLRTKTPSRETHR